MVSVIIPVYNGAKFIGETLNSVFDQTYPNIEIIVADDGSTDNTAEIVQSHPNVHYIYQENQGVSVARNAAISVANGEFIAFIDADDLWKPDKLQRQIAFMRENSSCRISATKALNFLEPDTQLPLWIQNDPEWKIVKHAIPSTMVVHTSVFEEVGLFSPKYRSSEDVEWIWRAKDAGLDISVMDDILTLRRYHGTNLSWITKKNDKAHLMKIIRESVARQTDQPDRNNQKSN